MFGRTIKCNIAKDNGRTTEFIRRKNYPDKSKCYECGVSGNMLWRGTLLLSIKAEYAYDVWIPCTICIISKFISWDIEILCTSNFMLPIRLFDYRAVGLGSLYKAMWHGWGKTKIHTGKYFFRVWCEKIRACISLNAVYKKNF